MPGFPYDSPSAKPGMGAVLMDGGCLFRVWAPNATAVALGGDFFHSGTATTWKEIPLTRDAVSGDGAQYWSAFIPNAIVDSEYKFHVKNDLAPPDWNGPWQWKLDPYSRDATASNGNSVVVDRNYNWQTSFQMPNWNELVIYELHIGTFNRTSPGRVGTFNDAVAKLDYLRDLGINAIEVMPAFDFDTVTSMGYNTSLPFAMDNAYGRLQTLKTFIDEAHRRGIAVILDVVYNHFGESSESLAYCLGRFDGTYAPGTQGIYFYQDWRLYTPWVDGRPDFGRGEVRAFLRNHAMTCLEELRADGLRLDSTIAIRRVIRKYDSAGQNPEGWTFLRYLGEEKRKSSPWKILIAEDLQNDDTVTKDALAGGIGLDAQWDNWFLGRVRNMMFAPGDGQRDPSSVADAITKSYNSAGPFQRVIYIESHDEAYKKPRIPDCIAAGDAGSWFARKRATLGTGLMLTAPGIPMLFMGQEFLEYKAWDDSNGYSLDWNRVNQFSGIIELNRRLIRLRRNWDNNTRGLRGESTHVINSGTAGVLVFHRWDQGGSGDDVVVAANLQNRSWQSYRIGFPRTGTWYLRFNSDYSGYSPDFGDLGYDTAADALPYDGMPASGNIGLAAYSLQIFSQ